MRFDSKFKYVVKSNCINPIDQRWKIVFYKCFNGAIFDADFDFICLTQNQS